MVGSIPYDDRKGCPSGFHKQSSYTSRSGRRVSSRCVNETRRNFHRRTQNARLHMKGKSVTRKCAPGMIERKGYVRKFGANVLKRGYTVKKASGKAYRIHPSKESVYVKPSCVKKLGSRVSGEGFGVLRKGELKKYGYVYDSSEESRHTALKKAIKEFGALGVFRKLDAVAKLSKRTVPRASRVFKGDREWIRRNYTLSAK